MLCGRGRYHLYQLYQFAAESCGESIENYFVFSFRFMIHQAHWCSPHKVSLVSVKKYEMVRVAWGGSEANRRIE